MILDNISRLCEKKGISIAKLEKESGLGNSTIRGWDKSSPRVENLQAVAKILECSVDDLLSTKQESDSKIFAENC